MSTFAPTSSPRANSAAARLSGKLVIPEHAAFEDARRAWNLAVDQRPAAVAFPESPHDVAAASSFAA